MRRVFAVLVAVALVVGVTSCGVVCDSGVAYDPVCHPMTCLERPPGCETSSVALLCGCIASTCDDEEDACSDLQFDVANTVRLARENCSVDGEQVVVRAILIDGC